MKKLGLILLVLFLFTGCSHKEEKVSDAPKEAKYNETNEMTSNATDVVSDAEEEVSTSEDATDEEILKSIGVYTEEEYVKKLKKTKSYMNVEFSNPLYTGIWNTDSGYKIFIGSEHDAADIGVVNSVEKMSDGRYLITADTTYEPIKKCEFVYDVDKDEIEFILESDSISYYNFTKKYVRLPGEYVSTWFTHLLFDGLNGVETDEENNVVITVENKKYEVCLTDEYWELDIIEVESMDGAFYLNALSGEESLYVWYKYDKGDIVLFNEDGSVFAKFE